VPAFILFPADLAGARAYSQIAETRDEATGATTKRKGAKTCSFVKVYPLVARN